MNTGDLDPSLTLERKLWPTRGPTRHARHPPAAVPRSLHVYILHTGTPLQKCQPCCQPEPTHAASSPVGLGDVRDGSDTVNYQERSTALIRPSRANEVPGIERCYANDGMQKARSNLGFILIKSDLLSSCFLIWAEMSPSESKRLAERGRISRTSKVSFRLEDELMNFRR